MDLQVSMSSDGISEVSAGASERVGGIVNGTSAVSGLLYGWESVGAETCVNNELAEVGS